MIPVLGYLTLEAAPAVMCKHIERYLEDNYEKNKALRYLVWVTPLV